MQSGSPDAPPSESSKPPVVTTELLKQEFIQDVVNNEIGGPVNLEPLAELCRNADLQPGLIFKCEPVPGGIGNIRNMFLNCFRFAIQAGGKLRCHSQLRYRLTWCTATGLVVPGGQLRNPKDLYDIHTKKEIPFDTLLDLNYFTESFTKACPQIKLYQTDADLPMIITPATQFNMTPYFVNNNTFRMDSTLIDTPPAEWRAHFDRWLNEESGAPTPSAEVPVLVYNTNCLLRWPFDYDSTDFVAQFGRILRVREDARRIAGAVLWAMSEKYHMNLDYSNPNDPIPQGKWMGAHLRTAEDATKAGWPNYATQEANYIGAANRTGLNVIFLSAGAPKDVERFSKTAKASNMKVETKDSLLVGDLFHAEKKALGKFTWDQKALVDYEVLMGASYFAGMFESSFSWNVALRRHVVVGKGTWLEIGPGKQGLDGLENPKEAFIDTYSAVFGPVNLGIRWQFPTALFP